MNALLQAAQQQLAAAAAEAAEQPQRLLPGVASLAVNRDAPLNKQTPRRCERGSQGSLRRAGAAFAPG